VSYQDEVPKGRLVNYFGWFAILTLLNRFAQNLETARLRVPLECSTESKEIS
jgi:hypothetical protein